MAAYDFEHYRCERCKQLHRVGESCPAQSAAPAERGFILEEHVFNHDKHYKALVGYIKRHKRKFPDGYHTLCDLFSVGSTVALGIWKLYDTEEWPRPAEAYAALRTAQRDKEFAELMERFMQSLESRDRLNETVAQLERDAQELFAANNEYLADKIELEKRAEAAETALSEARERTIQECAKSLCDCCRIDGWPTDMQKKPHHPYDDGERWVHEYDDGDTIDCCAPKLHTLLTSSATPPPQTERSKAIQECADLPLTCEPEHDNERGTAAHLRTQIRKFGAGVEAIDERK